MAVLLCVVEHDWEKAVMNLESMSCYLRAWGSAALLAMVAMLAIPSAEVLATAPAAFAFFYFVF